MRTLPSIILLGAALLGVEACDIENLPPEAGKSTTTGGSGDSTGGVVQNTVSLKCPVAATAGSSSFALGKLKAPSDLNRPPAKFSVSTLTSRRLSAPTSPEAVTPTVADTVEIDYTGWASDGKAFDSTLTQGHPMRLALNDSTAGWKKLLTTMQVGEERRVWMPAALAYDGKPPAGAPDGTLVFDVLLKRVIRD